MYECITALFEIDTNKVNTNLQLIQLVGIGLALTEPMIKTHTHTHTILQLYYIIMNVYNFYYPLY